MELGQLEVTWSLEDKYLSSESLRLHTEVALRLEIGNMLRSLDSQDHVVCFTVH
jgi:hypothetical protein